MKEKDMKRNRPSTKMVSRRQCAEHEVQGIVVTRKRKAKRGTGWKAPKDKPKGPKNAFQCFVAEKRDELLEQVPSEAKVFQRVGKLAGEMRKSLSSDERSKYEAKSTQLKETPEPKRRTFSRVTCGSIRKRFAARSFLHSMSKRRKLDAAISSASSVASVNITVRTISGTSPKQMCINDTVLGQHVLDSTLTLLPRHTPA